MFKKPLILNSEKNITIQVPDLPEKINYYYEPTEKLNPFDEASIFFHMPHQDILLMKDILGDGLQRLNGALVKAANNELQLPANLKPGFIGLVLNDKLNSFNDEKLSSFWTLSTAEGAQTLIYNVGDLIYLEIVPAYPWTFKEPELTDNYYSYEEFKKHYKPYAVEVIPLEVAKQWQKQCQSLLKDIGYDL